MCEREREREISICYNHPNTNMVAAQIQNCLDPVESTWSRTNQARHSDCPTNPRPDNGDCSALPFAHWRRGGAANVSK